ncbi:YxiG family protein [Streptococcus varani]
MFSVLYPSNAQNNSKVNMFMEIWNQVLFLETNNIEVDGIEFKL